MSKFTDQQYLKTDQYKDSSNLDARVAIHQRFSSNEYGWFKWVFDTLEKLPADAKILELGCGHGLVWKENADRIPSTWDITLSDLSSGMLDSAWRNLVVTGRNFKFKEISRYISSNVQCTEINFWSNMMKLNFKRFCKPFLQK